jgi:xylulokinase
MSVLGIDIGTSAVKVVLAEGDQVLASAARPLTVSRPQPGWSEQDPHHWWHAVCEAVDELAARQPASMAGLAAIGLSGQMHGATLLGDDGRVLRPCMLWNDGRSTAQCAELEQRWPALRAVTGNAAMPGFTAPKLLWVKQHEPEVFARIDKVLLPKAYVRWRLCGQAVEEMSDASGTLWLDVGARRWSDAALAASGLSTAQMPTLVEGSAVAGVLSPELCSRWGLRQAPLIAGGGGDNAAGAVAVGAVNPGDAFVSLGTSGVLWATTAQFAPRPQRGVHAFCHALPGTWHQMGVLLAAASALAWWAGVCGSDEGTLLAEAQAAPPAAPRVWFAPYLSGERTPHNDTQVRGGFAGLAADTSRAAMTLAVIEGVCHAMRDAQQALAEAGTHIAQADLIGGGARSALWSQAMADTLGIVLHQVAESEFGCALGAARLARMAAGEAVADVALKAHRLRSFEPRPAQAAQAAQRHAQWQQLYPMARDFAHQPPA